MNAVNGQAKDQLKSYVGRIENLEEQKAAISGDIKDVYEDAKANGFDVKALRAVIRLRKQDPDDRNQFEAALVTYMHALGVQSDLFDMDRFGALPRGDTAPVNLKDEIASEFRSSGILAAK